MGGICFMNKPLHKNNLAVIVALFIAMLTMPQLAHAKDYGLYVGGVKVTDKNCNNIKSNTIKAFNPSENHHVYYVPETNTLVLENVKIERTGGYNHCIQNYDCEGLTVKIRGYNNLRSKDSDAIRLKKSTTFVGEEFNGITPVLEAYSHHHEGVYMEDGVSLTIKDLKVKAFTTLGWGIRGTKRETLNIINSVILSTAGNNMASIAEVNEINLDNSSVEAWGESVSGIEFDNYLNLKEGNDLQKINVTGKCSITADDVAILFKGRGKIDGSGTLEVASKNKTAISLDYCYSKNKGETEIGELLLHNITVDIKGIYGIAGRIPEKHGALYINNIRGKIYGQYGTIREMNIFEMKECKITYPENVAFNNSENALCFSNGNIVSCTVYFDENVPPVPYGYIAGYPKATSTNSIEVKWYGAHDNYTDYDQLCYYVTWESSTSSGKSHERPYPKDITSYTIRNLEPNTRYEVNVWVVDEAGNLSSYGERYITTLAPLTKYNVYVAGVQVTSENCDDLSVIPGVRGTVKYDPQNVTLTLRNATIEPENAIGIIFGGDKDHNIELEGENHINMPSTLAIKNGQRRLDIVGPGSLDIDIMNSYDVSGIRTEGPLYFRGKCRVITTAPIEGRAPENTQAYPSFYFYDSYVSAKNNGTAAAIYSEIDDYSTNNIYLSGVKAYSKGREVEIVRARLDDDFHTPAVTFYNGTDICREVQIMDYATAIKNPIADNPAPAVKRGIYTLQGIRLSTEFSRLPAGVYIVDGKKVIKK